MEDAIPKRIFLFWKMKQESNFPKQDMNLQSKDHLVINPNPLTPRRKVTDRK